MISRRTLMLMGGAAAGAIGLSRIFTRRADAASETFEVVRSDDEWKKLLTPEQYAVLRHEATERPGSSPLNNEKRDGNFHCAGCDLAVYSSKHKYDSGTGWPSFYQSLPDAIGTKTDYVLIYPRTEVHCRRCGGHFGHIFDDGPRPTGKRHCLNGLALTFKPATASGQG
ncbi:MAG: peptide-methionine (R)-S-oxide reductase MsrB [Pseudomonadota bacterium]|nr:peptide-methionine (R)-S-oxide reductase MsrB [Pseudomonadota bacterium]